MREHAIPQDITGYRFHIIGNMTLKQFAELGLGCFVGFLFYTTNLPTPIKWPFIGLAVGLGAMTAFVPIEERPLDHWIVTFIKVLYKPTKFFWRREPHIPDPFTYTPTSANTVQQEEVDLRPARRQRIKEYLSSVEPPKQMNSFDLNEMNQINQIIQDFSQVTVANPVATPLASSPQERPQLKVQPRSFTPTYQEPTGPIDIQFNPQKPAAVIPEFSLPEAPDAYTTEAATPAFNQLAANEVARNLDIPEAPGVQIKSTMLETAKKQEPVLPQSMEPVDDRAYVQSTSLEKPVMSTQAVQVNTQLPFPDAPTQPNMVFGMVLTPNNDLVNGAIIEIQDQTGRVARAVKTNTLGQFFVTTPLESGSYSLLVEKEGLQFSPLRLDLTGTVMAPLEIRSVY